MCVLIACVWSVCKSATLYACRDATNDMALHFLAKMKILVVRDIERDDIEFICKVTMHSHLIQKRLGTSLQLAN